MINGRKSLPAEVVDMWPDVFNEVTLNVLPLEYVEIILINFKDGKTWEIGLDSKNNKKKIKDFQSGIAEIMDSYKEFIDEIDVKINTHKVKKDVEKSVKKLYKKLKI